MEILSRGLPESRVCLEVGLPSGADALARELGRLPIVRRVERVGASERSTATASSSWAWAPQVGQVAIGAVSEADRHNVRGEHISADTIPQVGVD